MGFDGGNKKAKPFQRLVALARALVEHETKASIKRAEFYALGLQKLKARQ